jgi:hypothetical protein
MVLNVKLRYSFLFLLTLFICNNITKAQEIISEDLFEYTYRFGQKVVHISDKMMDKWALSDEYIYYFYYNLKKDPSISSGTNLDKIKIVGALLDILDGRYATTELKDDGLHNDLNDRDSLYGNYITGGLKEFNTKEYNITISGIYDSLALSIGAYGYPIQIVPDIPKITYPLYNSIINIKQLEFTFSIDKNSDGGGVLLLDKVPDIGNIYSNALWEYKITKPFAEKISVKTPVSLENGKEYCLLIWSYNNAKYISGVGSGMSFSMNWSIFKVDTLNNNSSFVLYQNYPNPFNNSTTISWYQDNENPVEIMIYNILGNKIFEYDINHIQRGGNNYIWNGVQSDKHKAASGVYFITIVSSNDKKTIKSVLIR